MPQEKPQEGPSINGDAEAAARADWERLFQSRIPRVSDQAVIAAHLAEPMGRSLGLDSSKVPADLAIRLQMLREQVSSRKPSPLDESRVPSAGVAPTEE
jgi:hypothetical protein